jgi:hypothetical protein
MEETAEMREVRSLAGRLPAWTVWWPMGEQAEWLLALV